MTRHALKTDHNVFQLSWDEEKGFEVRLDDRNFEVGDDLLLIETLYSGEDMKAGKPLEYTGRFLEISVMCKIKGEYGIKDGWCILGTCLNFGEEYQAESSEFEQMVKSYC